MNSSVLPEDGMSTAESIHLSIFQTAGPIQVYSTLSHGNSYVFYEVANSYEFVRPHLYDLVRFV